MSVCPDSSRWFKLCGPAVVVSLFSCVALFACPFLVQASGSGDELDWAKEREFWSFRRPVAAPLPCVKNTGWARQALDRFVLSRLEMKGLAPAQEADRRTLIRRLCFDLTGLPPSPEEVDGYLNDTSAEAWPHLVERLLASPRFGEHMASLWLPLARYAEDQAYQVGSDTKFFYPNAYKYRDWVIAAFNSDLPYDQFIRLQLAADKVEGTNGVDLVALGFIGLGPKYYNRGRLDVMADEWEDRVDTVTRTFLGLTVSCSRCHDHKFDPITMEDYYALAGVFASTRMVNKRSDGKPEDDKAEATKMDGKTIHVVEDGEPRDLNVFLRGNVERKGSLAERRFVRILSDGPPARFTDGSGRRELADAISDARNPLTARVMVNRLWGALFGRPLVGTASNFGHAGELPSNPELLDWLAMRFMEKEWSIKEMVREMVLSATYQQSSSTSSESVALDPSDELLSRMRRRRLSVEQWRDEVLFVSGQLEDASGKSVELEAPDNHRRTVQARISRLKLDDLLMQFDYPDANVHAEKRSLSTTATQKLFMLNNPFMLAQAKALAQRVAGLSGEPPEERVRCAYRLLFGRAPRASEVELSLAFLCKAEEPGMSRWEQYAQVLLISNEMLYVD
jgi:hypothetical protein